jgi:hypothetical protein
MNTSPTISFYNDHSPTLKERYNDAVMAVLHLQEELLFKRIELEKLRKELREIEGW